MKLAKTVLLSVIALCLAGSAHAQIQVEEILGRHGDVQISLSKAQKAPGGTAALTLVYDNTLSAPNFGVSSTDLAAEWGDELFLAGLGVLEEQKFTIFNAGTSAGPLLTATVNMQFYDAVTAAPLGGYTTTINFGAGLPIGFFSTITLNGLTGLGINLNTSNIIVIQRLTAKTGTANRLGVASLSPVTVGASPNYMWVAASTIGGGVPGFYTFGAQPAHPGYSLVADVNPVSTTPTTWGRVKSLYR